MTREQRSSRELDENFISVTVSADICRHDDRDLLVGNASRYLCYVTVLVLCSFQVIPITHGQGFQPSDSYRILDSTREVLAEALKNRTDDDLDQRWETIRYNVSNFPNSLRILNRTVTCTPGHHNEIYAEPAWACDDIQVDGHRLPYAYLGDPTRPDGGELLMADEYYQCGSYSPLHDGRAMCKHMLAAAGLQTEVHFVLVTNASCEVSEKGILFVKNLTTKSYSWITRHPSPGYIISLRCGALT